MNITIAATNLTTEEVFEVVAKAEKKKALKTNAQIIKAELEKVLDHAKELGVDISLAHKKSGRYVCVNEKIESIDDFYSYYYDDWKEISLW